MIGTKVASRGIQTTTSVRPTSSRPTSYAKAGRQGQMLVKGCPCITKKKGKKNVRNEKKAYA